MILAYKIQKNSYANKKLINEKIELFIKFPMLLIF